MAGPRACAFAVAACVAASAPAAFAQRRTEPPEPPPNVLAPPRLPAPLVLPELAHPRTDLALTWTVGRGSTNIGARPDVTLAFVRGQMEGSILGYRRLYAGITWDCAAALAPDTGVNDDTTPLAHAGRSSALGNIEPHVRGVFPLTQGLLFGFVLGGMLPTSSFDRNGPMPSAMVAAVSMEPTDYAHFLPGHFAVRPAGDLRLVRGPFVFQARQGLDILIDEAGIERARTAGRILLHAGIAPSRTFEASIEASQIYFFFTEDPPDPPDPSLPADERAAVQRRNSALERYRISDDRRTAYTVGPSFRLSFPNVDMGVGLVTNLFSPLSPSLDSFIALRMSVVAHFR